MEHCINIPENKLLELINKAQDFALLNGLCMRSRQDFNEDSLQFAPFMLLPSPFPREEYNNACGMQVILNSLIHAAANNYEFLKESLKDIIATDEFTKKLFEIYETVYKEGFAQRVSLTLLRSDLMLNTAGSTETNCKQGKSSYCCWKQVEINTIASGHGWMGPSCTKLHRFVLQELNLADQLKNLPQNNALFGLCSGIIYAWKMYNDPRAAVLFIVEDSAYNICDQRAHEYEISKVNPEVKVIRKTLTQLISAAKLSCNKELIIDGCCIAVVYFRSGYSPQHYFSNKEWNVRLLVERSKAIKCPSIQYHLAGTKKVQQVLAKPEVIQKLLKDSNAAEKVQKIFTGLYCLNFDEEGESIVEMALQNPDRFVLKPQREGGCNNLFGDDIVTFLKLNKNKKERVAWILMDKICPPAHKSYMIRPNSNANVAVQNVVSELGIFGVLLSNPENIFLNKQVGHTLRTKLDYANEGGVATGLGACDTLPDAIQAVAKYEIGSEPREIYFFREGTTVMWNITDLECCNLLQFLKQHEESSYSNDLVQAEGEIMLYTYAELGKRSHLKEGDIFLSTEANLDKYTFSNAISQSVKLGIWEASLDHYVDSIEFITEDLKAGQKIKMSREEVLRKQGELFALRHLINLSSDLLDTPDFYWERDDLETLYQQTCAYFSIAKRTRVMNEKLNHCVELVELLSSHLSDRHHVRLEWMIIVLIMVEVGFEILHYLDRYLAKQED